MARTNVSTKGERVRTHGGADARTFSPLDELTRAVSSCMLFENQFYEDGQSIADRIAALVGQVLQYNTGSSNPNYVPAANIALVADLARRARSEMKLRHVPLWLLVAMVKHNGTPGRAVYKDVIQRPDEMGELIAMLWKDGKRPIPKQMKLGIGDAFKKFNAYNLAKYNRKGGITLTDVLRIVHPKPDNTEQDKLFASIVEGTLASPDTWEVALSAGADKKATFERLLSENKLGSLALLRNLRNMVQAGVDPALVNNAIATVNHSRTLPFRFVSAARHAPMYEPALDRALVQSIEALPELPGTTVVLVDVSGSMFYSNVSAKSDITRADAAATLGSMIGGNRRVFTFSNQIIEVAPRLGMAGVEAIQRSQPHSGTDLRRAIQHINDNVPCDRLIVITDEQTQSRAPAPNAERAYLIDVAGYQNGVNYNEWTCISGFSESVLKFIWEMENN